MLLKTDKPLARLDIESTGTDPAKARIVELCIAMKSPGEDDVAYFRSFINPGCPIPQQATDIHGITDEYVRESPQFCDVAESVLAMLKGSVLCGFGIKRFDIPMLCAEFNRCNIDFRVSASDVVDLLDIYHQKERRDLSAAVRFYLGREHTGAHSALADVNVLSDLLDAMLERYPDLPRSVDELAKLLQGDRLDIAGKFRLVNGAAVFTFGKYAGERLDNIVVRDLRYCVWLLNGDFLSDTKAIVAQALDESAKQARTPVPGCLFQADGTSHSKERL
jgi:DNA polymerase-3 subunit epsilon